MIWQLTEDEEEEQKRQWKRKERAEIGLKEAELKQAEKASQASKNPLRERRFVVRYKHFLKDLMFCYEKMKINWPIRRGLPNNLILFRQKGKYVKSRNCPTKETSSKAQGLGGKKPLPFQNINMKI